MNRLDRAFELARAENRAALIVFVTAGDPDLETTRELIPELARAGADVIELGVPHSDPIGDGPTIQASSERSLRHGTNLGQVLDLCRDVRSLCDVPLVLMGYLNNVLARGEETFVKEAAAAGVDGVIVVDAPYDEAHVLQRACEAEDVHRVLLVAPTSTPERVVQIATRARGFVYCVSVTGVTGARESLPGELAELIARVQRVTDTPVGVGFGIGSPERAAEVGRLADGVIVGSALVERVAGPDPIVRATRFVAELAEAIRGARV